VPDDLQACMGQRLVQIRPESARLRARFLLQVLLFVLSPTRISQLMVGSTSQHLNVKALKAFRVPLPPLRL
jgi:type I restriction enzyme S subunit